MLLSQTVCWEAGFAFLHISHLNCVQPDPPSDLAWSQNSIWAVTVDLQSSPLKRRLSGQVQSSSNAPPITGRRSGRCYLTCPSRYLSSIPSYSPAGRADETVHANSLCPLRPPPPSLHQDTARGRCSFVSTAQRRGGGESQVR